MLLKLVVIIGLRVMDIGGNKCSSADACPGSQKCDLPTHTCVCPHGFRITGTGCEGWSTHYMLFLYISTYWFAGRCQ